MWLTLKQGDTIHALIDPGSLQTCPKHWTGSRSEVCLGPACPHCAAGQKPKRRYQAKLLIDREPVDWEFGDETMASLSRLLTPDTTWVPIIITRTGVGRNTRIRATLDRAAAPGNATDHSTTSNPNDKYVKGRYGHMVQR